MDIPMPDDKLAEAFNRIYNVWFRSWRDHVSDQRWQELTQEGYGIVKEYEQYPAVWNLFFSLLYELSARLTGGYTEATRRKILALIEGGQYEHEKI